MNKESANQFFMALAAKLPQPRTELTYKNPYTLLVAVILSAQATDVGVNKATASLFEKIDNPKAMVQLGLDGLKRFVKSIGLYNTKAKNIIAMSEILLRDHGGAVPHARAALEALPGVGRKTASVILNEVFGEATIAVDTHVFRVATRTGLAKAKTPDAMEEKLLKAVPEKYKKGAHHWLILHGRYVCKARQPLCGECVVRKLCKTGVNLKG